jgi:hypothetical protein
MKLTALLAIRNEELFIEKCLKNLIYNGFEVILIDNESEDDSVEIAKKYLGQGLKEIITYRYKGFYDWEGILKFKEELAYKLDSDWFLHCDADEIHHSFDPTKKIIEVLPEIDKAGYNAVNFNEYVFVPTSPEEDFTKKDYEKNMRYYYLFKPSNTHRVKLWKKQNQKVDISSSGGHKVKFENRNIYYKDFILKHYIFLSLEQIQSKYKNRNYSEEEVKDKGWHGWRASFRKDIIRLPSKEELHDLEEEGYVLDSAKRKHIFTKEI